MIRKNQLLAFFIALLPLSGVSAQDTAKPVLLGKHWVAITGKPQGATAGAMMFQQGGNAVDAAAAMLAVTSTMWDVLSWGGETQALIYNPETKEVLGIRPSDTEAVMSGHFVANVLAACLAGTTW